MKVNRKSTPKMVVRPHFVNDYRRLERKQIQQERMLFTVAMIVVWFVFVAVWSIVR
jgi:hypothetical protein